MEYASKATGDAGLTTGIIGTALGALNSGLFNGVLGGFMRGGKCVCICLFHGVVCFPTAALLRYWGRNIEVCHE